LKALRAGVKNSLDRPEVSVIIVRGACAVQVRKRTNPRKVNIELCTQCDTCLRLGCPAIQSIDGQVFIEPTLCAGDICTICEQLCPKKAISA
jgi:indolepyruvate ferredoxin oxidoreductase alpha subunit